MLPLHSILKWSRSFHTTPWERCPTQPRPTAPSADAVSPHQKHKRVSTANKILAKVRCKRTHNTHPFNGPLFGTTRVSRYQKSKTNVDLTEARDSESQWHQLGHMQTICTLLQTDNHASTPPLIFLQAGRPSWCPTNSVKALKAQTQQSQITTVTEHTVSQQPDLHQLDVECRKFRILTAGCCSGCEVDPHQLKVRRECRQHCWELQRLLPNPNALVVVRKGM